MSKDPDKKLDSNKPCHPAGKQRAPSAPANDPRRNKLPKRPPILTPADEVEEASISSFPASDPPGYGTGHA